MRTVVFTLKDYLEAHNLSTYQLAKQAKGRVSRGTVYALAKGSLGGVSLSTLGVVMTALQELTGKEVSTSDLLKAVTLPDPDPETKVWLGSDLSRLGEFEPYDFQGRDPHSLGLPVTISADGQIVIGQE